jgi:hypothetical protein
VEGKKLRKTNERLKAGKREHRRREKESKKIMTKRNENGRK